MASRISGPREGFQTARKKFDEAVFAAYGWSPDISDDEILANLLALNFEREPVKKVKEELNVS